MEQSAYVSPSTMGGATCRSHRAERTAEDVLQCIQIVLSILGSAMFFTRRRNFQIFGKRKEGYHDSYLDSDSTGSSDELLWYDPENDDDSQDAQSSSKHLPKRRRCLGLAVYTPNTSRFSGHIHSRILQKFPFLIEMFYWIITYIFYRMTKVLSQMIFDKTIIDVAQSHGLAVLAFEQFSWASFLFPWKEHEVQQWFMSDHQTALTVLNRAYALIHIPGTVGYVARRFRGGFKKSLTIAIAS